MRTAIILLIAEAEAYFTEFFRQKFQFDYSVIGFGLNVLFIFSFLVAIGQDMKELIRK